MAQTETQTFTPNDPRKPWDWHPALPLTDPPNMAWPPRPLALLGWFLGRGYLLSQNALHIALGVLVWYFLTPALETMATFQIGWILEVWLRNLVLFTLIVGGLHLWLFTFDGQGTTHKFDRRPMVTDDARFLFSDQVRDNVFWSLISGVTIWTAFEVLVWWGWANSHALWLSPSRDPLWFVLWFLLLPFVQAAHFYLIHRPLHWRPLYRFHRLHHNNVNIGPWSGISMHPVEHVLYLSILLIPFVVPTHPIHLITLGFYVTVGAAISHAGFNDLRMRDRNAMDLGDFFHQLHHRYYNCNYGSRMVPFDKWFGSFHDGTAEATARIMKRNLNAKVARPNGPPVT